MDEGDAAGAAVCTGVSQLPPKAAGQESCSQPPTLPDYFKWDIKIFIFEKIEITQSIHDSK